VQPLFRRPLGHRGALVIASLFLITVVGTSLYQSYDQRRLFTGQRSPLYGRIQRIGNDCTVAPN
jgi:hypothetical protein